SGAWRGAGLGGRRLAGGLGQRDVDDVVTMAVPRYRRVLAHPRLAVGLGTLSGRVLRRCVFPHPTGGQSDPAACRVSAAAGSLTGTRALPVEADPAPAREREPHHQRHGQQHGDTDDDQKPHVVRHVVILASASPQAVAGQPSPSHGPAYAEAGSAERSPARSSARSRDRSRCEITLVTPSLAMLTP